MSPGDREKQETGNGVIIVGEKQEKGRNNEICSLRRNWRRMAAVLVTTITHSNQVQKQNAKYSHDHKSYLFLFFSFIQFIYCPSSVVGQ